MSMSISTPSVPDEESSNIIEPNVDQRPSSPQSEGIPMSISSASSDVQDGSRQSIPKSLPSLIDHDPTSDFIDQFDEDQFKPSHPSGSRPGFSESSQATGQRKSPEDDSEVASTLNKAAKRTHFESGDFVIPGWYSLSPEGETRLSMINAALAEGSGVLSQRGLWWMIHHALNVEDNKTEWINLPHTLLKDLQEHLPHLQSIGEFRFSDDLLEESYTSGPLCPEPLDDATWAIDSAEATTLSKPSPPIKLREHSPASHPYEKDVR